MHQTCCHTRRFANASATSLLNAEGAPTPAYPTAISDDTDALRAGENTRDTETVISWVAFEPPLQEPINVDVGPRTTTNEIAQPTGGRRPSAISFDGAAFNNRSEREEAGPAPRSFRPGDAQPLPRHKKSKKGRKNGKPSSKQEHCAGYSRGYGNSSTATSSNQTERPLEGPARRGSGRNRRNGPRRCDETPPPPTSSRSRNRSRDHTGSTVRSDSGPGSPRFVIRTPRIDSNESQLYKGFCWGWKPSWWPESWRWPDTVRWWGVEWKGRRAISITNGSLASQAHKHRR